DPRKTATAAIADLHLPVRPGGDLALLNLLGKFLLESGGVDLAFVRERTRDFEPYHDFLRSKSVEELLAPTGLEENSVRRLASMIAEAKGFLSLFCLGVNQSSGGIHKTVSVVNLHLLTGQIGKPGSGPFALTGQPNAMGVREVGLSSTGLPG